MGRNPAVPAPVAEIQFDKVVHWFEVDVNRYRCRKRNMTYTVKCSKCEVGLWLKKDINYFKDFHN